MFKIMDCKQVKEHLVAYLSGDLSTRERRSLLAHLATCRACSDEKEGLEKVWRAMGNLPEAEVPKDLREATISHIEEVLEAEEARLWGKLDWENWVPRPLAAVVAGVAMAFFSLWVLRGVTVLERLSYEIILHFSALLTGIFAGTFLLATGSLPGIGPRWQWASRIGLLSLGLTMLGTLFCPKMSLIEWWEMLPPGEFLLSFGQGVSHGAFGVIYAFLPFFLAVLMLGRKVKGDMLSNALSAGIIFLVLLLPAIYLQASPLSPAVVLSWSAGSTLGVVTGALCGVGFYRVSSSFSLARA